VYLEVHCTIFLYIQHYLSKRKNGASVVVMVVCGIERVKCKIRVLRRKKFVLFWGWIKVLVDES
jgi:translation initiation factor IF-2